LVAVNIHADQKVQVGGCHWKSLAGWSRHLGTNGNSNVIKKHRELSCGCTVAEVVKAAWLAATGNGGGDKTGAN